MEILIVGIFLFLCVATLVVTPKRHKTVTHEQRNDSFNDAIDTYNEYSYKIQEANDTFILELNKKQQEIVLNNDGIAYNKLIFLVNQFNQTVEILDSRIKEASSLIHGGLYKNALSILLLLNNDIEFLADLTKLVKEIPIEKNSFETTFHFSEEKPQNNVSYFDGCNTKEELLTRYKALSKVFHPDSKAGSKELFQQIQNQYEESIKKIGT